MITNATASIRSEVKNLSSIDPSLNYNDVAVAIAEEYANAYIPGQNPNLHVIDPSDDQQFPGIDNFATELKVNKEIVQGWRKRGRQGAVPYFCSLIATLAFIALLLVIELANHVS